MPSPRTDYDGLSEAFGALYEGRYGFRREPELAELVNLRVVGLGRARKPDLARAAQRERPAGETREAERRQVYFDGGFVDCPVFARGALPVGQQIEGPARSSRSTSTCPSTCSPAKTP